MLDVERRGRVAVLRLNRAERRNAIGVEMVQRLTAALDAIEPDAGVGAVVISAVAPGFCAGSDLKELAALDLAGIVRHEEETAAVYRRMVSFPKPVVSAVEGFAIGGGFLLAIGADVVVSARGVKWHLPEVQLGWIIPWGLQVLARRVGYSRGKMLAWGAEAIDGAEAVRLGVADVLVEAGGAEGKAVELAEKLAALPGLAVRQTKEFFEHLRVEGDLAESDRLAMRLFQEHCRTEEARATFERMRVKK